MHVYVYVMNTFKNKVGQLNEYNICSIFFSGPMFFLSIYTQHWQIECYVRDPLKNYTNLKNCTKPITVK